MIDLFQSGTSTERLMFGGTKKSNTETKYVEQNFSIKMLLQNVGHGNCKLSKAEKGLKCETNKKHS